MFFAPIVGIFAAIGIVVFVVLSVITGKPGAVLKNGLTIIIIVGIGLVGMCAITNISTTLEFQEISCTELPIEDHYRLVITKLANGSETGALDRQDGSARYQQWITNYAMERHYLVGQAQRGRTSDLGYEFFWVDLLTNQVQHFANYDRYLQSLHALGFANEPTLIPIDATCTAGKCQSCSAPGIQK